MILAVMSEINTNSSAKAAETIHSEATANVVPDAYDSLLATVSPPQQLVVEYTPKQYERLALSLAL